MDSLKNFSAAFQLVSTKKTAAEMAEVLEIEEAILLEKGQRLSDRSNARLMEVSIWRLESKLPKEVALSDHVNSLITVSEGKHAQLQSLLPACDAEIWCFISFDESQCGFELDPALIQKLSSLSVSLVFDIYS